MIAGLALACTEAFTSSSSELAAGLQKETRDIERRLRQSFRIGMGSVILSLEKAMQQFGQPNWDGYNALPVSEETHWAAERFLRQLPLNVPLPTVGAEPDGDLTLEWYRGPYRTLSVSINAHGAIHFSALLGQTESCGTIEFSDDVSPDILQLIRRVYAA